MALVIEVASVVILKVTQFFRAIRLYNTRVTGNLARNEVGYCRILLSRVLGGSCLVTRLTQRLVSTSPTLS